MKAGGSLSDLALLLLFLSPPVVELPSSVAGPSTGMDPALRSSGSFRRGEQRDRERLGTGSGLHTAFVPLSTQTTPGFPCFLSPDACARP